MQHSLQFNSHKHCNCTRKKLKAEHWSGNSLISIASQKGYTEVIEILKQHLEIDKVKATHDITSSPIEVGDILYDTLENMKSTDNTLDVIGNINDHPNSE